MPRKKSGDFDQKAYVNEYINTNIVYKSVNFNIKKEEDVKILEWINSRPEKISPYLKRLAREDMERNQNEP